MATEEVFIHDSSLPEGSRPSSPHTSRLGRHHSHRRGRSGDASMFGTLSPLGGAGGEPLDDSMGGNADTQGLSPEMLEFLRRIFDLAEPDERGLAKRETLRNVVAKYLEEVDDSGNRLIAEEHAQMLLSNFEQIRRHMVRFSDLCGVFRSFSSLTSGHDEAMAAEAAERERNLLDKLQAELDTSKAAYGELQEAMNRKLEEQMRMLRHAEEEGSEQIRSLQSETETLMAENKRLKAELRELSTKVESMVEESQSTAVEEPATDRAKPRKSLSKDQATIRGLRTENGELQTKVQNLELEVLRKRNEREEARALCAQYAANIAQLQYSLTEQEELRQRCDALEQANHKLQVEIEDLSMARREEDSSNKVSRRSLIMLEDELQAQLRAANQARMAAEAEARRAREAEQAALRAAAEAAEAAQRVQPPEQQNVERSVVVEDDGGLTKEELLAQIRELSEAKESLLAQLRATETAAAEVVDESATLCAAVAQAEERANALAAENARLTAEYDAAVGARSGLEVELQNARAQQEATAREIASLQASIEELTAAHRRATEDSLQARDQLREASEQSAALREQLANALSRQSQERSVPPPPRASEAGDMALRLNAQLAATINERDELSQNVDLLQEQLRNALAARASTDTRANRDVEGLREKCRAAEREAAELRMLHASEQANLEQALREARQQLAQLKGQMDPARVQRLEALLAEKEEQLSHVQQEREAEVSQLRQQTDASKGEIERLREHQRVLEESLESKTQEIERLQQSLQRLRGELSQASGTAEQSADMTDALVELVDTLQPEPLGRIPTQALQAAEEVLARYNVWSAPRQPPLEKAHFGTMSTEDSGIRSLRRGEVEMEPALPPTPPGTPKGLLSAVLSNALPNGLRVENIRVGDPTSPRRRATAEVVVEPGSRRAHTTSSRTATLEMRRERRAFEAHSYPVCVLDSNAAARLDITGQCWLRVMADEIAIVDPVAWETICAWPLHHIRHFGKNRDVFTFEAGESAGALRGVFYVSSDHTNEIFNHVSTFSAAMAKARAPPVVLRVNEPMPASPQRVYY